MTNAEYAAGLRELADFYETHPEMPMPRTYIAVQADTKSEFVSAVKTLADGGSVAKSTDEESRYPAIDKHHAKRAFGPIELDVNIYKSLICRRVQKMQLVDSWECPDSLLEETPNAA